jgi:hypothetical protein
MRTNNRAQDTMKPECHEGPQAFRRFDDGVKEILATPHSLIARRERAYKKKSVAKPVRPGPKPSVKPASE